MGFVYPTSERVDLEGPIILFSVVCAYDYKNELLFQRLTFPFIRGDNLLEEFVIDQTCVVNVWNFSHYLDNGQWIHTRMIVDNYIIGGDTMSFNLKGIL